MKVTVLVGGVGGARFLTGVRELLGPTTFPPLPNDPSPSNPPVAEHEITAIVNVGDDAWMHGVRICPDLDTCMYTLGDGIDTERGWGRKNETWHAKEELANYGADPDWFGLGDRDLATHLIRTQMLEAGYPLHEVTAALCKRWNPGVRLLPVTNDRHETHVVITDPNDPETKRAIHFQEWWVKYQAKIPTHGFVQVGADKAQPSPGVLEAIATADVIFFAPSNPIVSIGAITSVPGIHGALRTTSAPIVGFSPIIGGAPLRGMADHCLTVLGIETSAAAVAKHYGARSAAGLLDAWLIAPDDTAKLPGVEIIKAPLLMSDPAATKNMVVAGLKAAGIDLNRFSPAGLSASDLNE